MKIHDEYEVVIAANHILAEVLKEQCHTHNIDVVSWGEMVTWHDYESNPKIRRFKNCHAYKRCFLIGNGPSLCASDLDKLKRHKEISFGCNKIYKIFHDTKWRPDYFFAADTALIQLHYTEFAKLDLIKFIQSPKQIFFDNNAMITDTLESGLGETYFFNKIISYSEDSGMPFSEDPSKALHITGTVMYPMLQMAVYMGFREIYLFGVDNTISSIEDSHIFNSGNNHFYAENPLENEKYVALRGVVDAKISEQFIHSGYLFAESYCREYGIKIFNATRGGKLDIFERVDFDSLFQEELYDTKLLQYAP